MAVRDRQIQSEIGDKKKLVLEMQQDAQNIELSKQKLLLSKKMIHDDKIEKLRIEIERKKEEDKLELQKRDQLI